MSSSFPGPILKTRAWASALVLCLALLVCSLAGCSGPETSPESRAPAAASHVGATVPGQIAAPIAAPALRTAAALGRLVGRLPGSRRNAVRQQVKALVDRWWEAAYLSGETSRADIASVFPGFTVGARVRATADRELMTNSDLKASSITPIMRKLHLDLLAVNKRARSVTARFDLRVRVAGSQPGSQPRRLQVRGRLFLTPGPGGWKVFGYDVSKGWL